VTKTEHNQNVLLSDLLQDKFIEPTSKKLKLIRTEPPVC